MASTSSGGGSGSNGSGNKVAALLLGAGAIAIISIFGPRIINGDDDKQDPSSNGDASATLTTTPIPTTSRVAQPAAPVVVPPTLPAASGQVTLTIIAYGMPVRIGARAADPNAQVSVVERKVCTTDLYPEPCIVDYKVNRDTVLVVTAGNSLAGFWPALDSVKGAHCNIGRVIADQTCTLTMGADRELVARYYGDESPGGEHVYPKCPPRRPANPTWELRCT